MWSEDIIESFIKHIKGSYLFLKKINCVYASVHLNYQLERDIIHTSNQQMVRIWNFSDTLLSSTFTIKPQPSKLEDISSNRFLINCSIHIPMHRSKLCIRADVNDRQMADKFLTVSHAYALCLNKVRFLRYV